jgi:hypothetical protein
LQCRDQRRDVAVLDLEVFGMGCGRNRQRDEQQ